MFEIDQVLEALFTFSRDARPEDFQAIFGAHVGRHLFEKFADQYQFDLLALWGSLDTESRARLASHLVAAGAAGRVEPCSK